VAKFAQTLGPKISGKIVIDATNPMTPFPELDVLWNGTSGELSSACADQQLLQNMQSEYATNTSKSCRVPTTIHSHAPAY